MYSHPSVPFFIHLIYIFYCIFAEQNCTLDLGVVLDESSSISRTQFNSEKRFVKFLTNSLTIGVSQTRVSILGFSSKVRFHSRFRDYPGYSKDRLDKLLDRIQMAGKFQRYPSPPSHTHKIFVIDCCLKVSSLEIEVICFCKNLNATVHNNTQNIELLTTTKSADPLIDS